MGSTQKSISTVDDMPISISNSQGSLTTQYGLEQRNHLVKEAGNLPLQHRVILSGFPCLGKSLVSKKSTTEHPVFDLDSSNYKIPGTKQTDLQQYMEDISTISKLVPNAIILVSCHQDVRREMLRWGLKYIRVFPSYILKDEWLKRAKAREQPPHYFTQAMDKNWDAWMELADPRVFDAFHTPAFTITHGEDYLADKMKRIIDKYQWFYQEAMEV